MIKVLPVKKIGMTSAFDGSGTTVPVTLVQPEDVYVVEIKRPEKHGFASVKLAYGQTLVKRLNKPHLGELKKAGIDSALKNFYEVRMAPEDLDGFQVGQRINPHDFLIRWAEVKATGTSKGKGFAGAVKRWGFAGQCRTHGDPDNRRPMANNSTDPARVFKGAKRPGRMGGTKISVKGTAVFEYDRELNILALNGSIPGPNGSKLFITLQGERTAEQIAALTPEPAPEPEPVVEAAPEPEVVAEAPAQETPSEPEPVAEAAPEAAPEADAEEKE